MLSSKQKDQLIEFSGLPFNPDMFRDELLHEMFENTADKYADKVAVESPTVSLTYAQLDRRANRFARYLRSQGIGTEDKVAFQLPRDAFVYVAMLGIMKAGAAYVPLDPSYPADRVSFILQDCGAKLFVTAEEIYEPLRAELEHPATPLLLVTQDTDFEQSNERIPREKSGTTRENLAYIIYTSGTTGRPKGCLLEHRNICNEVRSAAAVYEIKATDRVFQGFSVAFDASLEEIWMAFFNGCTLVVGTKEIMRSGADFSSTLGALRVTVLSCVPTLLSMVENDIPSLRIIIFGGEACPPDLAARWHRPGRTLFNSYGPTEATVIATCGCLQPNRPVTIGRAIPNYKIYIVDEHLELLPPGETGELCIGGPSVARGYLNRDDLTKEKFVEIATLVSGETERVYRTGDLAQFDESGDIVFLGRADDQVKLRGFRVELSEIESVLMQCPGIQAAAVTLNHDSEQLAAYVVMLEGSEPMSKVILRTLRERLPAYMIPAWLDVVDTLPMLVSGKVNRKLLPTPSTPLIDDERQIVEARTPAEAQLQRLWKELFSRDDISIQDDFFMDLGGHSLLAARLVSRLRAVAGYADVSMADIYRHTTIESLAKKSTAEAASGKKTETAASSFHRSSRRAHFICGVCQALLLPIIIGVHAWVGLGPFLVFDLYTEGGMAFAPAVGLGLLIYGVSLPLLFLLPFLAKWLLLGRMRPGRYPLWGWYYLRFWFVRQLWRAMPMLYYSGTPGINFFYRLMGAKIGENVVLNGAIVCSFDLLQIGDNTTVGVESSVDGYWVENGMMCLDTVAIGSGCVVGNRSVVSPGSSMADNSALGDLSLLNGRRRIPSLEKWSGSPAQPDGHTIAKDAPACWTWKNVPLLLCGALLLPLLGEVPIFPGLFAMAYFDWYDTFHEFVVAVPLIAVSFIILVCIQAAVIKRCLLPKVKEGVYPINSFFYVRHWFFSRIYHDCLLIVGTVFSTLYLRFWFRLLGSKLGKGTEISTASNVQPDLLHIGNGCFVADDVMLGAPAFAHGYFTVGRVHVGDRTFVGNSAVIPAGSVIGQDCLVGCLSITPPNGQVADRTSWFGSPPLYLPNRQRDACFNEALTYKPPVGLLLQRYAIEAVRVILPNLLFVAMAMGVLDRMVEVWEYQPWLVIPLFPVGYFIMAVGGYTVLLILKWLLVGRYKPTTHPLWCNYVWRTELITGAYESFATRFLFDMIRGTPFISMPLRLLGMSIGKRCYVDSTWFTELDLLIIGDETALNEDANLQTHLFEDRVMKEGVVTVGNRCSIGSKAFILYDATLGDEVSLDDLSCLMKGESLPACSRWHGIPCRQQDE